MSRSNSTIRFLVSGRVQGVFFRMHTRQQALRQGLTGWVRNLPDGRVEGVASGAADGLESFQSWLNRGPEHARVIGIEIQTMAYQSYDGFDIK